MKQKITQIKLFGIIMTVALLSTVLIFSTTTSALASTTMYSGRAIGINIDTNLIDMSISDTGDLDSQGGTIDTALVSANHELVNANVLLAVTSGFDNVAQSESATSDVTLLPGHTNEITADFVRAESKAVCDEVSGQSEIVNLMIGGNSVMVSGNPNQTITVPGVFELIINEQIPTDEENEIVVNALRLTLATGEEVIVSHTKSGVSCGTDDPTPKDFVTGGGFIKDDDRANFGFVSGIKPNVDSVSGQFNYVDKKNNMHLKSTEITSYDGHDDTRTFSGTATINGNGNYSFTVTVTDNGEPGKQTDLFAIEVSNGYNKNGLLQGGNIQLHS